VSGSVADDEAVVGAVDEAVLAEGGAYGGVTAAPLDGDKPKKPAAPKPDLVIVTVFDRPEGFTDAQEVALVQAKAWSPATIDFVQVAKAGPRKGTPLSCSNVGEFLGALQGEPAGSLSRVVLVSHSTEGLLGFGGNIDAAGTVGVTRCPGINNPLAGGVDLNAINGLKRDYQPLLDEVKTRWAEGGGELVFFSCGSGAGVNLALMQEFAKLIGARAAGFSYAIGYCVKEDGKRVLQRGHTAKTRFAGDELVIDCENAKLGYAHLTPDRP
jgi:hypothetical protein